MHISKKRDLYFFLFCLACANFVVFVTISAFLGGSAASGYARAGHYFVGEHGKYTEVPVGVYYYSLVHTWASLALVIVGVFAGRRARALQHEIGDYDPVTMRTS